MKMGLFLVAIVSIIFLCNITCSGQTGWKWAVAGDTISNNIDEVAAVLDRQSNIFVLGFSIADTTKAGPVVIPNYYSNAQMLLIKADSSGNFLWGIGTQYSDIISYGLTIDATGNAYIYGNYPDDSIQVGAFMLYNPLRFNMNMLAKVSPSGSVLWAMNMGPTDSLTSSWGSPLGGLCIDNAGYIYAAGEFSLPQTTISGTTLFNANTAGGKFDIFIAKYDQLGSPVWVKSYGGVNNDGPNDIIMTQAGNIYVTGIYYSGTNIGGISLVDSNNFLAKFDNNGNAIWAVNLSRRINYVTSIEADALENVYMTGDIKMSAIIGTDTLIDSSNYNFFVAKYSPSGAPLWARSGVGRGVGDGYDVSPDKCGNVWVMGGSDSSTINFSGHVLPIPTSINLDAMFILCYDTSGNYISGMTFPAGGDDLCSLLPDNRGNLYLAGDYVADSFVLGANTLYLAGISVIQADENLFLAKYKYGTMGCKICDGSPSPGFTYTGFPVVNFTYTGSVPYDSLVWHFGDGTGSYDQNPVHTYTGAGAYNACVDLYNVCLPAPGYVSYCQSVPSSLAVTNISTGQEVNIYPNPANNEIIITASGKISDIQISNAVGQKVYSYPYDANIAHVDIAALAKGIYFIKVNNSIVRKFVKE